MAGAGVPRRVEPDLDAVAGQVTAELLNRSHLMRPADMMGALTQAARPLGVSAARIYLADLQQRQLALLQISQVNPGRGHAQGACCLRQRTRHVARPHQV